MRRPDKNWRGGLALIKTGVATLFNDAGLGLITDITPNNVREGLRGDTQILIISSVSTSARQLGTENLTSDLELWTESAERRDKVLSIQEE